MTKLDSNAPNWELLKNHMYREGRVSKEHCQRILRDTLAMISKWVVFKFCREGTESFEFAWSSYSSWRYSWAVLRFCKDARCRRSSCKNKIPVPGRLCGQRFFLLRSGSLTLLFEAQLSSNNFLVKRKPWVQIDDSVFQLQSWMHLQIWSRYIRIVHGDFRCFAYIVSCKW